MECGRETFVYLCLRVNIRKTRNVNELRTAIGYEDLGQTMRAKIIGEVNLAKSVAKARLILIFLGKMLHGDFKGISRDRCHRKKNIGSEKITGISEIKIRAKLLFNFINNN